MNDTDTSLVLNIPLFNDMPKEVIDRLIPLFVEETYQFGQSVVNEGDEANAFYIISSGKARVLTTTATGREIALQTLTTGDFFGEMGLLDGGIRSSTVRASSQLTVLCLSDQDFRQIIQESPEIYSRLIAESKLRKICNFLRQNTKLNQLSQSAFIALAEALYFNEFLAGHQIISEGDDAGPLFIIYQGRCRVYHIERGKENDIAYLRAGDYFGELSFIKGIKRTAHVKAVSDCTLLSINYQTLSLLTKKIPELNQFFDKQSQLYYTQSMVFRQPLDFTPTILSKTARQIAPATNDPITKDRLQEDGLPALKATRHRILFPDWRRKLFIKQIDEADCGAAALGMVCRYFGSHVSLAEIRRLSHTTVEGTSMQDLCLAGKQIGLTPQALKIDRNVPEKLTAPAIIHWQNNHWIVLLKCKKGNYKIADPATKISWIKEDKLKENWSGYAISFAPPTMGIASAPVNNRLFSWIGILIKPFRLTLILTILLTTIISGLQLSFPILTQYIVDNVMMLNNPKYLNLLVSSLGIVLIITLFITILQRYTLSYVSARLDGVIMEFLMKKMMSLPMRYFFIRSAEDIQRRLEGASEIRHFLVHSAISGISAGIQIIVYLCLMAYLNLRMTQIYLILVPIYVGLMYFSARSLKPAFDDIAETDTRYNELQNEVVKGIQTVKAAGAEKSFRHLIMQDFIRLARHKSKSYFNVYCYDGTVQALGFLSTILFLWIGAQLVMQQRMTIGEFIAFQMITAMSYNPLINILNMWEDLQYNSVLFNRINDVIESPSEDAGFIDPKNVVTTLQGKVELRNVNVAYNDSVNNLVLQNINLTLNPGQIIGLVGNNNSGKSTLAKCLATLLEPMSGKIYYDGLDKSTLELTTLRRFIGLVIKNDHLFTHLTIIENIAFGDPNPHMDQVIKAAKIAAVHDKIMELSQGYQTRMMEAQSLISSNFNQQVAIARAIYRDPSILILDDAFHDLDRDQEQFIIRNLCNYSENRVLIMITTRLRAIEHTDITYVMDHGQIIESGTHLELLAKKGLYFNLWHS